MSLIKPAKKKKESEKGRVVQDNAVSRQSWQQLEEAYEADSTLPGRIIAAVKGGLKVKVLGVVAFLPSEHISTYPPRWFVGMKNQEIDVKITKLAYQGRRVFVSHDLVLSPLKHKPKVQLLPPALPKAKPKAAVCKRCGKLLSRSYSSLCAECKNRYRMPVVRGMVQGGSPGLPKKVTLKIGKAKA